MKLCFFLLENLNWSEVKKPNIISLSQPHQIFEPNLPNPRRCNTNDEAEAFTSYLKTQSYANSTQDDREHSSFFKTGSETEKQKIVVISHQPFNDRQQITVQGAVKKANLFKQDVVGVGPGVNTYQQLNALDASVMSPAQIVDNLARTLFQIFKDANVLLIPESGLVSSTEQGKTELAPS